MKIKSLLILLFSLNVLAQNPTISGDLMLCPNTNGTAIINGDETYDSYQWYFKYWFLNDDYVAIPDATNSTFTYDWYTYDQALFKVVVTLNGNTYESNSIQIDSWNWVPLSIMNELNDFVNIDPDNGNLIVCNGHTVDLNIFNPFTENIIWFKNGVAIEGAHSQTYTVTEAGSYAVQASPGVCPNNSNSTLNQPLTVVYTECNLSNPSNEFAEGIKLYPNPTSGILNIDNNINNELNFEVFNINLKSIKKGTLKNVESKIDLEGYSTGTYIIKLSNDQHSKSFKIIKK